jgi:hypothetical protein
VRVACEFVGIGKWSLAGGLKPKLPVKRGKLGSQIHNFEIEVRAPRAPAMILHRIDQFSAKSRALVCGIHGKQPKVSTTVVDLDPHRASE